MIRIGKLLAVALAVLLASGANSDSGRVRSVVTYEECHWCSQEWYGEVTPGGDKQIIFDFGESCGPLDIGIDNEVCVDCYQIQNQNTQEECVAEGQVSLGLFPYPYSEFLFETDCIEDGLPECDPGFRAELQLALEYLNSSNTDGLVPLVMRSKFLQYNENRNSLQATNCGGVIVMNIPVSNSIGLALSSR